MMQRYDDYDPFADLYDRRWGGFATNIVPTLDHLALGDLDPGATVVDLCCGSGQLLASLGGRGLDLIGVDGSAAMIERAAGRAPQATFVVDDARTFALDRPADVIVSTFDSLNHLMTADDLALAFQRVAAGLAPGGRFVFDLNDDDGYRARWTGSFADVGDDEAIAARSTYEPDTGLATITITHFVPVDDLWQRVDMAFTQRCHPDDEVRSNLAAAGLADIERWDASELTPPLDDVGRSVYRCRKPPAVTV